MKNESNLPGRTLHRVAQALLDEDDLVRAAEPAIADLQLELAQDAAGVAPRAALRARLRVVEVILSLIVRRRVALFIATPWVALIPPAVAVMMGTWAFRSDTSLSAFGLTQLVFLTAGLFVAVCAGTTRFTRWQGAAVAVGPFVVLSLFAVFLAGDEMGGTRRWLRVGPLRVQLALAVWPMFLAALAGLVRRRRMWGAAVLVAFSLALLALEGDALACAAWAVGGAVVTVCEPGVRARWRVAIVSTMAVFAVCAIVSAPSLPPVAHVEGVWMLVASRGPLPLTIAALAACLVPAAPWVLAGRRREPPCATSLGVAATLATLVASPLFLPNEPVALFGYGGSAIVGTFLAFGMVLASARDAWALDARA
jgi:hypothetical protein